VEKIHFLRERVPIRNFVNPVNANDEVGPDANRYAARPLISGAANTGHLYAQQFLQP
jgi:hypothetical protein